MTAPSDARTPSVIGTIDTPVGVVPRVATTLTRRDSWGTFKARWGVGRMRYAVTPGLYAVGSPGSTSTVLVTANYKMSFDRLRANLSGRDAWILVLDTSGINVWCAAGKGTFGTEEIVRRVRATRLSEVVTHRRLVLPQLGAPGVAAHEVRRVTGFTVVYGPVLAEDLPAFLDAGMKARPEMRRKTFPMKERFALIPVELVAASKVALIVLAAVFLLGGLGAADGYWAGAWRSGLAGAAALALSLFGGTILVPLLLPWLPGRSFSMKGAWIGIALAFLFGSLRGNALGATGRFETAGWMLLILSLTTYMAMNFTGATTFTSLSGVKKEMRFAIPVQIGVALLGMGLWIGARFVS